MAKMIDTKKKVKFYDDRGKDEGVYNMGEILFENNKICLCKCGKWTVLFDKKSGEVLTHNLEFYYAENVD